MLGKSYPNFRRAQGRRPRQGLTFSAVVVLGAAALLGAAAGAGIAAPDTLRAAFVPACRVVDGDTLRCGSERVRLLGIDAPELPGHCAAGRICAPGDPVASSRSLGLALAGRLTVTRVGVDRYGRTLALVTGRKGDLSCWQLRRGAALYKPAWDNGGRVAALCPGLAR